MSNNNVQKKNKKTKRNLQNKIHVQIKYVKCTNSGTKILIIILITLNFTELIINRFSFNL